MAGSHAVVLTVAVPGAEPLVVVGGATRVSADLPAQLRAWGLIPTGGGRIVVDDFAEPGSGAEVLGLETLRVAGIRSCAAVALLDGSATIWTGSGLPHAWTEPELESLEHVAGLAVELARGDADARYRRLVEMSPDAIIVLCDDALVYVNDAALCLLGAAAAETLRGRSAAVVLDAELLQQLRDRVRAGRPAPPFRGRLRRLDGTTRIGEVAATPTVFDGRAAIQLVVRDVTEEDDALAALRRREQEFKELVEEAPDAIVRFDGQGRVTYVNPAVTRYSGIPAQQFLSGSLPPGTFSTRFFARWRRALRGVVRSGQPALVELDIDAADGPRTFQCRIMPHRGAAGVIESVLAVGRDITGLKRAEAALRLSEGRLRGMVESASVGITLVNAAGEFVDVNRAFAEMLGYRQEELRGLHFRDVTHPDDVAETEAMHRELIAGARPRQRVDKRYLRRNGTELWARLSTSLVAPGPDGYAVGMVEDVTAHKAAQEALRESEARFRSLIEHSSDLIAILDAEGLVHYQSASVERVLGYGAEELLGREVFQLVHRDDVDVVRSAWAQLRSVAGSVTSAEFRTRHRDGSWVPLRVTAQNRLDDPAVGGIVINARDLTSARELEAQLLQSQKMEAVGRLAGGVAHDFNNILTAVQGHASLLAEELPPDSPHRLDVEQIQRSAERAASLTRHLLAFSRRQVLQPRVIDLNDVVVETEMMLRRLIGEDIELRTELGPDAGRIRADPAQIQQILLNLAVNARDAMPTGGQLVIRTRLVRPDEALVGQLGWGVRGARYALLTVSDTGSGIEPAIVDQVFEPFFTTKEPGQGTGLGLSSVYGTVRQSGGHIAVDTTVGEGTTFRIYLPQVDDQPEGAGPDGDEGPSGSGVILLAEDEPAVRALARRVLERAGYTVLEAVDGEQARQICARHDGPIDLVLTDVVMPRLSGAELAVHVARLRPGTRMLLMSGYTQDALGRRGVIESAGFLGKPFSPELLRRAVGEALRAPPPAAG